MTVHERFFLGAQNQMEDRCVVQLYSKRLNAYVAINHRGVVVPVGDSQNNSSTYKYSL